MKKILALFLVMLLLCTAAMAESIDYSAMSDDELQQMISTARNELVIRNAKADGKVFIIDNDLISLYFTGKWSEGEGYHNNVKSEYFQPELVFVNKTDKTIDLFFDRLSVNGWEISYVSGFYDVSAGNKKKGSIQLFKDDIEISDRNEIEDMRISFHISEDTKAFAYYEDINITIDSRMWN